MGVRNLILKDEKKNKLKRKRLARWGGTRDCLPNLNHNRQKKSNAHKWREGGLLSVETFKNQTQEKYTCPVFSLKSTTSGHVDTIQTATTNCLICGTEPIGFCQSVLSFRLTTHLLLHSLLSAENTTCVVFWANTKCCPEQILHTLLFFEGEHRL